VEQTRPQDRVADVARAQPLFNRAFRVLERRARTELLEKDVDEPFHVPLARSVNEAQLTRQVCS
jgi:hypothetical protein